MKTAIILGASGALLALSVSVFAAPEITNCPEIVPTKPGQPTQPM